MPTRKKSLNVECQRCDARFKSAFCDLKEEEVIELNANKGCLSYKKGQLIYKEGSFAHGLYSVINGKVKISQAGDLGREYIVRFAREGDIIGYQALLSGDEHTCSATAIDDTSICFIPKQTFFRFVSKNSVFSLQIMKLLAKDLGDAEHKMTDLAQKPVRERMAEALLFLKETYGYEQDGSTINVTLTREEIANMVGTVREMATRLLSEFREDGIVELVGKKIRILSKDKLLKTANIFE